MDIICLGIMVVDVTARYVNKFPKPGTLVVFDSMELHNGGCAMNTAVALGRLGVSVGVIGKVGNDIFGDHLLKVLENNGADGSRVIRDSRASTSFTLACITSNGERGFIHTFGANAALRAADVNFAAVKRAKILHVAGFNLMPALDGRPAARILQRAKAAGVITTLDTAYNDRIRDWFALIRPCLPHLSYFIPSYEEAVKICGTRDVRRMARFLRAQGVEKVVVKLGARGSYYYDGEREISMPVFKVKVVDTTGAGDAFVGGFLYGTLHKLPPGECLRWGNAVAAQCVTACGASAGIMKLPEIKRWMKKAKKRTV